MTSKVVRLELPETLLVHRTAGRTKCAEEGRCRMCERPSLVRPLTRHHLVPQSWWNRRSFVVINKPMDRWKLRDADANVVPLCAPCHTEIELHADSRRSFEVVSRRRRRRS